MSGGNNFPQIKQINGNATWQRLLDLRCHCGRQNAR
jgi:hypothetical protein